MLIASPLVSADLNVTSNNFSRSWRHIAIVPGRSVRFAPDWECSDAGVVFDRNSGDYWVVSQLAILVLKILQDNTTFTVDRLQEALASLKLYADMRAALAQTLQSLIDNRLVRATS